MADILNGELSQISGLQVKSHTTAMQFKGTSKKVPEIAAELGVDAVVEGSVHRESNRVVVSVQLIEGPTGRHLWATNYERPRRIAFHSSPRRSKVVPRFMNEGSGLSLLFAVLVDASAGWHGVKITPAAGPHLEALRPHGSTKALPRLAA